MNVSLCGIRVLKMQAIGPFLWVNMMPASMGTAVTP